VRAASVYAHVFEVTVDYVNISGFNVIGATGVEKAGFYLNGRQHCNILDNIADSNPDAPTHHRSGNFKNT